MKLKDLLENKLPKKREDKDYLQSICMTQEEKDLLKHWDNGFNDCLREIGEIDITHKELLDKIIEIKLEKK